MGRNVKKEEWIRDFLFGYGICSPIREAALWIYVDILPAFLSNMNHISWLE